MPQNLSNECLVYLPDHNTPIVSVPSLQAGKESRSQHCLLNVLPWKGLPLQQFTQQQAKWRQNICFTQLLIFNIVSQSGILQNFSHNIVYFCSRFLLNNFLEHLTIAKVLEKLCYLYSSSLLWFTSIFLKLYLFVQRS